MGQYGILNLSYCLWWVLFFLTATLRISFLKHSNWLHIAIWSGKVCKSVHVCLFVSNKKVALTEASLTLGMNMRPRLDHKKTAKTRSHFKHIICNNLWSNFMDRFCWRKAVTYIFYVSLPLRLFSCRNIPWIKFHAPLQAASKVLCALLLCSILGRNIS